MTDASDSSPSKRPRFSKAPDLCVVIDEERLMVHSVVLMLASPVFAQMLQTPMGEMASGEVALPGKSKDEFLEFVDSLQLATMKPLSSESAVYLSRWANEYQVASLTNMCDDYMVAHMPVDENSFETSFEHAVMNNLPLRASQCMQVAKSDVLRFLSCERIRSLIFSDDELIKLVWPAICSAAGLTVPHETIPYMPQPYADPPAKEGIETLWPFVRNAIRHFGLVSKVRNLPHDLYHHTSHGKSAAERAMQGFLQQPGWCQLMKHKD